MTRKQILALLDNVSKSVILKVVNLGISRQYKNDSEMTRK